jgi:hypothetical protein
VTKRVYGVEKGDGNGIVVGVVGEVKKASRAGAEGGMVVEEDEEPTTANDEVAGLAQVLVWK